jgi:uncharacterized membrane protein
MIAAMMGLAAAGLADALYLVWVHVTASAIACPIGSCDVVNASAYAKIGNFPVAGLGAIGYLGLLAVSALAWRAEEPSERRRWVALALAGSLAGVGYSIYLTYLELYVIKAICFYCVISAIVVTLLCLTSALALRRPRPG